MNSEETLPLHICVKDLKPGSTVLQMFQVKSKEVRKTRSGQEFLDMTLGDATGNLPAKMWSDAIRKWGQDFKPGDFVKVEARVDTFRDQNQLVLDKIRRVEPSEVPDIGALVKTAPVDTGQLFDELISVASKLEPPELGQIVQEVLARNEEAVKKRPAAWMVHHAYQGGLIEHMSTVTRKVEALVNLDKSINRNIALAGAILHDIGKVREMSGSGQDRTVEGRLIGHLVIGVDMIREAARSRGLVERPWLRDLEHVVLSHHGELQFGSPVKPLTREALLVHFVDNLDSKLKVMEEALESADEDGFSPYNRWIEGKVYAGSLSSTQEDDNDGS